MQKNERLLSCDWGTTAFRLRLIDIATTAIVAEEKSKQGSNATFEAWKQSGREEHDRLSFYLSVINEHTTPLEQKLQISLSGIPVVISGMASSTIGMIELPYKELPFAVDGSDLEVKTIKANDTFNHDLLIISGAKTSDDVMRGEETKIIGCVDDNSSTEEQLFILPGTHPKHITTKEGKVTTFETYMTGEYFDLLSKKSILSNSVEEGGDFEQDNNKKSFMAGVKDSLTLNLLHSSFLVRTNNLFNKFTKSENYYYLSGLLIGTELKEYINYKSANITIVSNTAFRALYEAAFNMLSTKENIAIKTHDADEALIKGQLKIYKEFNR